MQVVGVVLGPLVVSIPGHFGPDVLYLGYFGLCSSQFRAISVPCRFALQW